MADDPNSTDLTNKQYLIFIVRLLVNRQGDLQLGTLIDINKEAVGRFRKLAELPGLMTGWLERWVHGQDSPKPDDVIQESLNGKGS